MLAKLIQPERMPSFFAHEEMPLAVADGAPAMQAPRPSWVRRLAGWGRVALETHRATQRARSAAAW